MTSCLLLWNINGLPKQCLLLKERICSNRSKFLPLRVLPIVKGGKNENGKVVVLLFYTRGKQLRSCQDDQFT